MSSHKHMAEGDVRLLNSRGHPAGNAKENVGAAIHLAAVLPGKANGQQALRARATSMASRTLGELPLVEMPIAISPALPSA